ILASSAAFACSCASSGVARTYALRRGLSFSMRSMYARVSSVEETSRRRTAAAWSSADANGSIAVNGADSGGRVGRRRQGALECGRVFGRNRHKQPAARLGVAEHYLVHARGVPPIDLVAVRIVVAAAPAGKKVAFCKLTDAFEEWDRAQLDVGAPREIGEVPDQAIASDVRGRGRARGEHRLGCLAIEGQHDLDHPPLEGRRADPALDGRRHQPGAERFGEEQNIAAVRALVADEAIRMDLTDHRITELRLRIVDRVAADDGDP